MVNTRNITKIPQKDPHLTRNNKTYPSRHGIDISRKESHYIMSCKGAKVSNLSKEREGFDCMVRLKLKQQSHRLTFPKEVFLLFFFHP